MGIYEITLIKLRFQPIALLNIFLTNNGLKKTGKTTERRKIRTLLYFFLL